MRPSAAICLVTGKNGGNNFIDVVVGVADAYMYDIVALYRYSHNVGSSVDAPPKRCLVLQGDKNPLLALHL